MYLDVGGAHFHVPASVIRRQEPHLLSVLTSNDYPSEVDDNGYLFVDRDSHWFATILAYLRDGTMFVPHTSAQRKPALREAQYYGVQQMCEMLRRQTCFVVFGQGEWGMYNLHTGVWDKLDMPFRSGTECCSGNGILYVTASPEKDDDDPFLCTGIERFDPGTGRWGHAAKFPAPISVQRLYHVGHHLMVLDGEFALQAVDLLTGSWQPLMPPSFDLEPPSYHPIWCACQSADRWYVFGCTHDTWSTPSPKFYGASVSVAGVLDSPPEPWRCLPDPPITGCSAEAAVPIDGKVFVLCSGGTWEDERVFAQVYDPAAQVWRLSSTLHKVPRGFHWATEMSGSVVVVTHHHSEPLMFITVFSRSSGWDVDEYYTSKAIINADCCGFCTINAPAVQVKST